MLTIRKSLLAALISVALPFASAHAGLMGSTATSQYYAYGSTYNGSGSPTTFTVDGGAHAQFFNYFNITVTNNQIIFDYNGASTSWSDSAVSLNSAGLFIENGNLLSFSGADAINTVTLDPATNLVGFGAGNLSFNSNQIAVNWVNLAFNPNSQVVLNVNTTGEVPVPATFALIGLGALGLLRRSRSTLNR